MFEKRSEPGEYVIRQGDDGDNFYVIENGVFDVLVNGDDGVEKVRFTFCSFIFYLFLRNPTPRYALVPERGNENIK